MSLTLTSPAFADGSRIPERYACDGDNVSPPLKWTAGPEAARSFALVCSDPDAPVGTWYHWAVYNIPPDVDELREGYPARADVGATRQAVTDFGRPGYGGPCPPPGHGDHRYRFHLMALDVATLPLPADAPCRDVEEAAKGHSVAETVLAGLYSR